MIGGSIGQKARLAGYLLLAGLLGVTQAAAQSTAVAANPPVPTQAVGEASPASVPLRLKMQTAFNPALSVIGEAGRQFTATLKAISAGNFSIKLLEAGRVAATPDLLDAVVEGSVDAAFTSPIYAAAKQP